MKHYIPNFIPGDPRGPHDFAVYRDVRIPVCDGVEMTANIYFPAKNGKVDFGKKYPVIVHRNPYMGTNGEDATFPGCIQYFAADLGYVFIHSGIRGTFRSGGDAVHPVMDEGWGEHHDSVDVINWITAQPWCDGRIVTVGISWPGNAQYSLWLADETPDSLVTSCIFNPAMNGIDGGWPYTDEFLNQGICQTWTFMNMGDQLDTGRVPADIVAEIRKDDEQLGNVLLDPMKAMEMNYPQMQMTYGLEEIPVIRHMPYYRGWLAHRDDPDYFYANDIRSRKHDVKKPILFIGSWFDLFNNNTLYGYERMVTEAPDEAVAESHRLIIGTWPHCGFTPMLRQYPNADIDMRMMHMDWIQQQVNGITSAFFRENRVTLFDVGSGKWRSEKAWPLPDTVTRKYYLHSDGPANSFNGRGTLTEQFPGKDEAPDQYRYDPSDPILQPGGHSFQGGQSDQRAVEKRLDVLCYTTDILEEDVDVTGYVRATLYAATSAEDTDFIMKLVDVCPDGNCYNVLTGGRRGRYLKNGRREPAPLTPGEINMYQIELHATCCTFLKGHRIRVEICSSDAMNYDINPNAFIDLNKAGKEDYVIAEQTIYHSAEYPSCIELPVVSASHEYAWFEGPIFDSALSGFDYAKSMLFMADIPLGAVEKDREELPH